MDPKEKKKARLKKLRTDQEIFNLVRLRRQEADRVENEANSRKPKRSTESGEDPLWSEKVSTIRNRLTGSKRTSKDRWNRFAGTEGGGGRGL